MIKSKAGQKSGSSDDYFRLVRRFPLRVLKSDAEHEEAVVVLSRLVGRSSPMLSIGEREYADALSRFIEDYDDRHYPMPAAVRSPLDRLKYLLAENDMSPSDLALLLGASQPLVSQLLTGKRNLTPAHMRHLGERFKVEPGFFL